MCTVIISFYEFKLIVIFLFSAKSLEFGGEVICIDIGYPDEIFPKKYYHSTEKSRTFEVVSHRNHTIKYDSVGGNAYMKHSNGQYIKMERQLLGEKFYRYKNSVVNVIVPCNKFMQKRKYLILSDIVTNKPRRERNSEHCKTCRPLLK